MLFRFVSNIDVTPIVFLLPSAIIGILLPLSLFVAADQILQLLANFVADRPGFIEQSQMKDIKAP